MRRRPWWLIGLVAIGVGAATARDGDEPGFAPLFDGKGLDGWERFGGKAEAWGVEDGLLVSRGEGGGWLGTTGEHADFVLRLEFRLAPGSNSGVYLRAPADTSHISRTGLEVQVLDDPSPRYKDLKPWQFCGAIYHVAPPERGHLKPTGEWNAMEIRAEGPHVVVALNGATVVDDRLDRHPELEREHAGLKRARGRIGLQSHDGRVEFRKVRIKDLKPGEAG